MGISQTVTIAYLRPSQPSENTTKWLLLLLLPLYLWLLSALTLHHQLTAHQCMRNQLTHHQLTNLHQLINQLQATLLQATRNLLTQINHQSTISTTELNQKTVITKIRTDTTPSVPTTFNFPTVVYRKLLTPPT